MKIYQKIQQVIKILNPPLPQIIHNPNYSTPTILKIFRVYVQKIHVWNLTNEVVRLCFIYDIHKFWICALICGCLRFRSCNAFPNFVCNQWFSVCCCSLCKMKRNFNIAGPPFGIIKFKMIQNTSQQGISRSTYLIKYFKTWEDRETEESLFET